MLPCTFAAATPAAFGNVALLAYVQAPTANDITISGKVTDAGSNSGLPGVAIRVEGTTKGTISDVDGNFTLSAPADGMLVISSIGYTLQKVPINNQTRFTIALQQDVAALKEVVVVGYGETNRRDLTGSVVTMDAEAIQQTNKVNAYQAIQGQVPGVNIQSADNKPGGGFNIRIRGSNTINSNQTVDQGGFSAGQNPLFVVDGIFVNDINFLNPSDIERMDVLKDASATAIYGSRGSNGVIIIQTKRGSKGPMTVQYDNYVGVRQAYNLPRMFNGPEFIDSIIDGVVGMNYASGNLAFTRNDVVLNDFLRPNEQENVANNRYTDWVDLVLKNGFQTNHTIGVSGGSDNTTYGFGVGYTKDKGTFEGEDYERMNLRGDINGKLSSLVSVGFSNYASFSTRNEGSREGLRSAYRLRPTGTPYDENGKPLFFPLQGETFITNPLFEPANAILETKSLNYLSNLSLIITPTDNLKFTSTFSPNLEFSRFGEYRGQFSKATSGNTANTRAEVINRNRMSYTWDNIVNYNLEMNEDNVLNATFVYSQFLDRYESYDMQRRNFSTDAFSFYNIDAGSVIQSVGGNLSKQTLESFTGRVNYNFKQKYLFTLTGRYDGSSILSAQNKWAFFPSAAFAWRIKDESFLVNNNLFYDLKARFSYGQTGNNGGGGGLAPLGSQSLIGSGFTNLGDQVVQTAFITNLANQNLTWEKTKEFNVGLDFGFLQNRIYGSLDIYNRKNTGIIFYRPVPTVTGYSGVFENVGEAVNKGVEFGLTSVNVAKPDFTWKTNLNFAANRNEVTKLYGDLDEIQFWSMDAPYVHRIGEPVGSNFSWIFDGVWQLDEIDQARAYGQQPGQVKVKDINNDGVIDAKDRTVVGSNMPKWTGGITNTINYKNIDFSFFLHTAQGATAHSYFHRTHAWDGVDGPARFNTLKVNYWTPENASNETYQRGNGGPWTESLLFKDVSYVKVGYITLGYSLPESAISFMKMKRLRVYATAQNPFVFTNYDGWDPENAARNSWGAGVMSRVLMGGVNVNF
ncbi:TonB-dependent receptor [Pontibacter qinzhouensis]|uniref:TonB-dependent receptor n=1 Tax=Pontibacter qinzhouensis TaxID=2603253 RepID=A0A5C8JIQ1_9BACT|nr:TonB-dependent receptor [Pontibacter qinzhouensis]TXK37322.1 TonB-dependent receptor [Pontibacter qinzhouensis]